VGRRDRVPCAGRGQALGLALVSCRPGAAEVSGVQAGPQGRRTAMRSSLEAGGAAPYYARHPPVMSGGVSRHHDLSGCGAGQDDRARIARV
jgi:hypothetical protein